MIKSLTTAFATTLVLALPLFAQDSVKRRNGTTETGTIEAENYDGVAMKAKQGNQERPIRIALDDVASIHYQGDGEYRQAVGSLSSNLGNAITKLQALKDKKDLRALLRPLVLFQLASAQERAGQYQQAAANQLELIKASPKTRWLVPAVQSIVECHLALGNAQGGTAAVEEAATVASGGGVDATFLTVFDYFRGRLFEAQKNLVSARVKYQSAANSAGLGSLAQMARLGVARCDQAEGKADQAGREYEAITALDSTNEVLAGAWNGRAELALDKGAKDKSIEQVMNAMFMFLRGVVEYGPAPGEPTGEYERALAGSSKAFKQLADLETDEAKKKTFDQRARARMDQLKKEFPNSRYLDKK